MDGEPYEVLGVARDASAAEVRKAYFRLVRVHSPEDSPEEFARISAAYQVLSDPAARQRLDSAAGIPDEARLALEAAAACLEDDADGAARRAQAVLAQPGQVAAVRLAAASICVQAGAVDVAMPHLEELVARFPDDLSAVGLLGDAYRLQRRFGTAGTLLKDALKNHPDDVNLHVGLARVYQAAEQYDRADWELVSGIAIHGPRDSRSVSLHFRRLSLLAPLGKWTEMFDIAGLVRAAIPKGDDDLRRHVVANYTEGAYASLDVQTYDFASFLLEQAYELAPSPELRTKCDELAPWATAQRESRVALESAQVSDWIKQLLLVRLGPPISDEASQEQMQAAAALLAQESRRADADWAQFMVDYPAAAALIQEARDAIRESSAPAVGKKRKRRPARGRRAAAAAHRELAQDGARSQARKRARKAQNSGASVVGILFFVIASIGMRACARSWRNSPRSSSANPTAVDEFIREQQRQMDRMSPDARAAFHEEILRELESDQRDAAVDPPSRDGDDE